MLGWGRGRRGGADAEAEPRTFLEPEPDGGAGAETPKAPKAPKTPKPLCSFPTAAAATTTYPPGDVSSRTRSRSARVPAPFGGTAPRWFLLRRGATSGAASAVFVFLRCSELFFVGPGRRRGTWVASRGSDEGGGSGGRGVGFGARSGRFLRLERSSDALVILIVVFVTRSRRDSSTVGVAPSPGACASCATRGGYRRRRRGEILAAADAPPRRRRGARGLEQQGLDLAVVERGGGRGRETRSDFSGLSLPRRVGVVVVVRPRGGGGGGEGTVGVDALGAGVARWTMSLLAHTQARGGGCVLYTPGPPGTPRPRARARRSSPPASSSPRAAGDDRAARGRARGDEDVARGGAGGGGASARARGGRAPRARARGAARGGLCEETSEGTRRVAPVVRIGAAISLRDLGHPTRRGAFYAAQLCPRRGIDFHASPSRVLLGSRRVRAG